MLHPKQDNTNVSDSNTTTNTNGDETDGAKIQHNRKTTQSASTNATTEETPVTGEVTLRQRIKLIHRQQLNQAIQMRKNPVNQTK